MKEGWFTRCDRSNYVPVLEWVFANYTICDSTLDTSIRKLEECDSLDTGMCVGLVHKSQDTWYLKIVDKDYISEHRELLLKLRNIVVSCRIREHVTLIGGVEYYTDKLKAAEVKQ